MMRFTTIAILAAAIGCNAKVDETDGGGGSAGQGGAELGPCPESGACQQTQCGSPGDAPDCAFRWECTLEEPCGQVQFVRDDGTSAITLQTPDNAACVLEALRDGTEGSYSFYITGSMLPGQFSTDITIHVRSGGVALQEDYSQFDVSTQWAYRGPASLRDRAFFEACLVETDGNAIYECLHSALSDACE